MKRRQLFDFIETVGQLWMHSSKPHSSVIKVRGCVRPPTMPDDKPQEAGLQSAGHYGPPFPAQRQDLVDELLE